MNIDDYQEMTNETAISPEEVPDDVPAEVLYTAMGLSGETGEWMKVLVTSSNNRLQQ